MLKLVKYEFIKKYKLALITLVVAIAMNLYLLTRGMAGSTMFLALFPVIMAVVYIGDIIKMYGDDLNKKSGYMLFMTPKSGYEIIISKLITAIIEGLAILLLYFVFVVVNGSYIIYNSGIDININHVIVSVNDLLSGSFGFNLGHLFMFLLTAMLFLISFITTAYTAMTIRKSVFSEVKFGGAISFIIFILLNWALTSFSSEFYNLLTPYYNSYSASMPTATELVYIFLPINIFSLIQSIILTICSGYLLEKKINL